MGGMVFFPWYMMISFKIRELRVAALWVRLVVHRRELIRYDGQARVVR